MVEQRRARRRQRRVGAAIAASLAIVVTAAGLWIAGHDEQPSPAPSATGAFICIRCVAGGHPNEPTDRQGTASQGAAGRPATERRARSAGRRTSANSRRKTVGHASRSPTSSTDCRSGPARARWPNRSSGRPRPSRRRRRASPSPSRSPAAGTKTRPDPTPTGPLHVLRMQPQGSVSVAPFVSVTFDQPMVPIATVGQLATARRSRHHHPEAGRHLAVDRHQHRPLRGRRQRRGPATDGHRLHPQRAGRHAGSERCDAGQSGHSDLQHAGSDSEALPAHRCRHGR